MSTRLGHPDASSRLTSPHLLPSPSLPTNWLSHSSSCRSVKRNCVATSWSVLASSRPRPIYQWSAPEILPAFEFQLVYKTCKCLGISFISLWYITFSPFSHVTQIAHVILLLRSFGVYQLQYQLFFQIPSSTIRFRCRLILSWGEPASMWILMNS